MSFADYERRKGFTRWITRGSHERYAVMLLDGGFAWHRVTSEGRLVDQSTGRFYNHMTSCAPTWRKHHPSAIVETVQAVRRHLSKLRSWGFGATTIRP